MKIIKGYSDHTYTTIYDTLPNTNNNLASCIDIAMAYNKKKQGIFITRYAKPNSVLVVRSIVIVVLCSVSMCMFILFFKKKSQVIL